MKKIILTLVALVIATTASAVRYQGFVESTFGANFPSKYFGDGVTVGVNTSHGAEIINGLFVGGGTDFSLISYEDYNDTKVAGAVTFYGDVRYRFLKTKISPFAGVKIGGGYEGINQSSCFYFSPQAGCSFNFTGKFGLDVSVAYKFYGCNPDRAYFYCNSMNGISLGVGLHF